MTKHEHAIGPIKKRTYKEIFWNATCDLSDLDKLNSDAYEKIMDACKTQMLFQGKKSNTKTDSPDNNHKLEME